MLFKGSFLQTLGLLACRERREASSSPAHGGKARGVEIATDPSVLS